MSTNQENNTESVEQVTAQDAVVDEKSMKADEAKAAILAKHAELVRELKERVEAAGGIKGLQGSINRELIAGCYYFLPKDWLTSTPPKHEFCVNPLVPIGAVSLLNAHGGTGKSLFALKMAIHIALGLPFIQAETKAGKVAYMSLEDSVTVVQNRIFKIFRALPKKQQRIDELASNIMIIDRYGLETHMLRNEISNNAPAPITEALTLLLKENEITCLFVDTFIRTNTLNENDNAEMSRLLVAYEGIARNAECGLVLIHHLPKFTVNRSYSARGASAITDNSRSALLMQVVQKGEVGKFTEEKIKDAVLQGRLIEVSHIKHNYSGAHPKQYLKMTKNGILLEAFPKSLPSFLPDSDPSLVQRQRYKELYACWVNIWKCRHLTENYIVQNVGDINSLANTDYKKRPYIGALYWAIDNKYANEVPHSEVKNPHPNAKYYTLKNFEDEQPPISL